MSVAFGVWQPIATAPRGQESEFLGWDGFQQDKTWEGWEEDGKPVYMRADWVRWEPTHWTPLPDPPSGTS
jgi:hypothetical protein